MSSAPGGRGSQPSGVSWVLFDLNGTLLDPSGLADPLGGRERDVSLVTDAFHDALLLTMADTLSGGAYRPLPEYLRATLERALRAHGRDIAVLDAVLERAAAMDPFPEAETALSLLRTTQLRVGVLTNSTTAAGDAALTSAGLRGYLDVVIGTDRVETFKPHPRVYRHAVERVGANPLEIVLVAAHAWDVMGALRSNLRAAWVARSERWLVPVVPEPDVCGADLTDVAEQIVARLVHPTGA